MSSSSSGSEVIRTSGVSTTQPRCAASALGRSSPSSTPVDGTIRSRRAASGRTATGPNRTRADGTIQSHIAGGGVTVIWKPGRRLDFGLNPPPIGCVTNSPNAAAGTIHALVAANGAPVCGPASWRTASRATHSRTAGRGAAETFPSETLAAGTNQTRAAGSGLAVAAPTVTECVGLIHCRVAAAGVATTVPSRIAAAGITQERSAEPGVPLCGVPPTSSRSVLASSSPL